MKQIVRLCILAGVTVLMAGSCGTAKLAVNTTDEEGRRIYFTSEEFLFRHDGYNVLISIGARVAPGDTLCGIMLTCTRESEYGIFKKGDKITFRLDDGTVITSENILDKSYGTASDPISYAPSDANLFRVYDVNPFNGYVYRSYAARDPNLYNLNLQKPKTISSTTTYSYAMYLFRADQMTKIIDFGVSDLTIRIEDQDVSMPNPGNLPTLFTQMYELIREKAGI